MPIHHATSIALFLLSIPSPSNAMSVQNQSIEKQIESAEVILFGKILKKESFWSDFDTGEAIDIEKHKNRKSSSPTITIRTRITIRPLEVLKGRTPPREITLQVIGGSIDKHAVSMGTGHRYAIGSCVVALLNQPRIEHFKEKRIYVFSSATGYYYASNCDGKNVRLKAAYRGQGISDESNSEKTGPTIQALSELRDLINRVDSDE